MNHYPHHIGDFNTATRHLSRLERDVYRDMRDMYFDTEVALDGSSFDLLARRLCCRTPEEIAALQFVLAEFFVQLEDGRYQNEECEGVIAQFQAHQSDRTTVKGNENVRQKRSRARRAAIFAALRSIGVVPAGTIKSGELMELCRQHSVTVTDVDVLIDGVQFDTGSPAALPTSHGHVTVTDTACHADGTGNQNQNQNHISPQPPAGGQRDGLADALKLQESFPSHRRTRTAEVAALMAELVDSGAVTVVQLQAAAAKQSAELCRDGGKASPSTLRWLRESRWLDSSVGQGQPASMAGSVSGVPADWSATRSGVIAMGVRLGLGEWDESRDRIFATYEARVQARLTECEQGVRSPAGEAA